VLAQIICIYFFNCKSVFHFSISPADGETFALLFNTFLLAARLSLVRRAKYCIVEIRLKILTLDYNILRGGPLKSDGVGDVFNFLTFFACVDNFFKYR
jgi:hypothetical protein